MMSETTNKAESGGESVTDKKEYSVVGVRFKPCGKIYTFEADGIDVSLGTWVVVESEMGLSLGLVVKPKHKIENPEQPLKKIIRIASEEDMEADRNNRPLEEEAKAFCIKKAKDHNLPMKIVATEATLDRKRLIFYFTADGRIDFRRLVRDLAARFKTRIEMRQIGVRDEAKMIGGIGVCGRQTCCTTFLTTFEPVSIRMAKKQELAITQNKLSGICGRLMCCLGYELEEPAEDMAPSLVITEEPGTETFHSEGSGTSLMEESREPEIERSVDITEKVEAVSPKLLGVDEDKKHPRLKSKKRRLRAKAQRAERKRKGKPFSRRRDFWRKKKH